VGAGSVRVGQGEGEVLPEDTGILTRYATFGSQSLTASRDGFLKASAIYRVQYSRPYLLCQPFHLLSHPERAGL